MPAGALVLPHWANVPRTANSRSATSMPDYPKRKRCTARGGGHAIVGGHNYGQGSSRENAALAPRTMGLGLVVAKSFARIHWQNLVNFGVLPLTFVDASDYESLKGGDKITIRGVADALAHGKTIEATVGGSSEGKSIKLRHELSKRQIDLLRAGGVINQFADQATRH